MARLCSIENCSAAYYARGWCKRHYYRWARRGDPSETLIISPLDRVRADGKIICTKCREWLSPSAFAAKRKTWCRECRRLGRYGIGKADLMRMLERQGGKCPICREREPTNIDHDHTCCPVQRGCQKCIRGVLCHQCNASLGIFKEDVEMLKRAIEYISGGKAL